MKQSILLFFLLSLKPVFANDGAYFASGNQLIPISENDVSITKEILTIKRKVIDDIEYADVSVDYTFHNPNTEKTILVGFEAPSPEGDVNGFPKNGAHPYMSNFKSIVNGEAIEFETSIVNTDNYYVKNQINKKTEAEVITDDFNSNSPEFYYVYHFNAVFKPGLNSIVHTYRFNMSGGISENYSFDYILTAANRWANKQIDDFTLNIHMGEKQGFEVSNSFFKDKSEWIIENGRSINKENQSVRFIIHDGKISFKQKDFHPKGELFVKSIHGPIRDSYLSFDSSFHNLPNKIDLKNTNTHSTNEISFKILRNLPYAIRGYVFNNSSIQNYYLSQYWYKPNPRYEAKPERLNEEERNWMQIVKSKEWDRENN